METPNTRRGRLRVFARRLCEEMELRKISIRELASWCSTANGELQELNPEGKYKKQGYDWENGRLKDIRQAAALTPKSGSAKELIEEEIEVICRALNRPPEYMLNGSWNRNPIYLDPLFDDGTAEFIGHLIGKAESAAKVLTGWAEFLPCSLETPEFMHQHHRALHKNNLREEERANNLAERYDRIGNFRRAKFEDRNRNYDFEHLMFRSHLLNIADGKREYVSISKRLREECLRNLAKIVLDKKLRLRMFITPDEKCETLKEDMRGNDSMLVFGRHFTLWRNHIGDISWNENEFWINRHAKWADEFKSHSISNPTEVADALNELAERAKRK